MVLISLTEALKQRLNFRMEDFEKEIFDAADVSKQSDHLQTLEDGCRRLCLITEEEKLLELREGKPWTRGGAESFIATGVLVIGGKNNQEYLRKIILKAYSGFSPPEEKVKSWQARSTRLSAHGIPVSRVYSVFRGVLFAEFVEFALIEFLVANNNLAHKEWAAKSLDTIIDRLNDLKVHPISLLPDLRTDGSVVYLCDFGEDLGDVPGPSGTEDCRLLVRKELAHYGFPDVANLMKSGD